MPAGRIGSGDGLPNYLVVYSAGNTGVSGGPVDLFPDQVPPEVLKKYRDAIAANKLIYVAGWDKDVNGKYIRHAHSSNCGSAGSAESEGCLWAQYGAGVGAGTSLSAPQVAAALASVLSVFPDTTHQNLAKFAKACAKKSGQGIEVLLRESGGVGVADFTCMGGVTNALTNLPAGGRTNVTIQGQVVSVGGRDVALSFMPSSAFAEDGFVWEQEGQATGYSVNVIPTGGENSMLVGLKRMGDFFASAAIGTTGNFFGFADGHGGIRSFRLTAGHREVFAHVSETRSTGGRVIGSAEGRVTWSDGAEEIRRDGEIPSGILGANREIPRRAR